MRLVLMAVLICGWVCCKAAAPINEGAPLFVWQEEADKSCGGTNFWYLSTTQAVRLPKWHPSSPEPPLSLEKALRSAKKWIDSKGGGEIEQVVLRPLRLEDSSPYRHVFYYRISFGVSPYLNHLTCIVLMDGTVLKPECHPYREQR
jgi:hypothetical protein